jgi:hypothetical protein
MSKVKVLNKASFILFREEELRRYAFPNYCNTKKGASDGKITLRALQVV